MKIRVPLKEIALAPHAKNVQRKSSSLRLQKGLSADREIHLRMMRAEEAEDALSRFIDDAVLAGLPSVRIVHGKGGGILRKMSQELLRKHSQVKRFFEAPPDQGGQGVTIAEFE